MAAPGKYTPSFSFAGFQGTNPARPLPGVRHDTEYWNIAYGLNGLVDAFADLNQWLQSGGSGSGDGVPPTASAIRAWTGDAPPPQPWHDGDLWVETDTGNTFVYYDDGNSTQWIQCAGHSTA